jgi:hypothetical protein
MQDPLQRLYRTKLTLLAVILTVVGIVLMVAVRFLQQQRDWHWLARLPIGDIGSALFTTGLVAVAYGYIDGRDSEVRATARLHRVLEAEAPAIRDAVIDGFAFKEDDLARVATPETLDRIISNSLALRLGDRDFANEVYEDVRTQAVRAEERWHDAGVSIDLSLPNESLARERLFVTTVRWEYSVVPKHATRRFACVSDIEAYRELAQEAGATSAWYVRPDGDVEAASREAFELVQFTVDGVDRPISRSVRKAGQIYSVNLGDDMAEGERLVTISYTYRTLSPQHGHLLYVDIEQPTRGVDIELDFDGCGISYVNVLDFIASSQKTRVSTTPASLPTRSVGVQFDGWVFPKSGVAFVWVLEQEMVRAPRSS